MRAALLALMLSGCVGSIAPAAPATCTAPAFLRSECRPIAQAGATQCENGNGTAWVFYQDGSFANVELAADGTWTADDCLCRVASDGETWFGW